MRLKYFVQFYGYSFRFLCPSKENLLKNSLTPSYYSAMTMQHGAIRWFAQNRKVGNQCSLRGDLVIPGNPHRNWILFNLKLKITSSAVIAIRRKKALKRNKNQFQIPNWKTMTLFSKITLKKIQFFGKSAFRRLFSIQLCAMFTGHKVLANHPICYNSTNAANKTLTAIKDQTGGTISLF